MALKRVVLFILLLNTSVSNAQWYDTLLPVPTVLGATRQLKLWATEYYVHVTPAGGDFPFLSMEGDTLAYCGSTCDFCTACLEGTVFLTDHTGGHIVLNYAGRAPEAMVNCRECGKYAHTKLNVETWGSIRWKMSSGYGEGVKNYALVPYRTIAVDPNVIPYGTVLYIPEARGIKIRVNDTKTVVHDGYFFAGDTGGAIKANHIDVFTGIDTGHPFAFVHSDPEKTFTAFEVKDTEKAQILLTMHKRP